MADCDAVIGGACGAAEGIPVKIPNYTQLAGVVIGYLRLRLRLFVASQQARYS